MNDIPESSSSSQEEQYRVPEAVDQVHHIKMTQSEILFQQGRYADAEKVVKDALAEDPSDIEALIRLAACIYNQGRREEAYNLSEQFTQLAPDHAFAHYQRAFYFNAFGQFQDADFHIRTAIQLEPEVARFFFLYACISYNAGQVLYSDSLIDQALSLDPEYMDALHFRMERLIELDKPKLALEVVNYALTLDPENARSHQLSGQVYLNNKQSKNASSHLREALRLNPSDPNAKTELVEAYKQAHWVYRPLMRLLVFNANKPASSGFLILLIMVAVTIAIATANAMDEEYRYTTRIMQAFVLVFGYIAWRAKALSDALLLLNFEGRNLLSAREKRTAIISVILGGFVFVVIGYVTINTYRFDLEFTSFAMILYLITLPPIFNFFPRFTPWLTWPIYATSVLLLLCCHMGLAALLAQEYGYLPENDVPAWFIPTYNLSMGLSFLLGFALLIIPARND